MALAGDGLGAGKPELTQVIVTLEAPPLSAFGRSLSSARHLTYARQLAAAQNQATRNVLSAIPISQVRWRYRLVANGFSVVLPKRDVGTLARLPGVAKVWPNVTYRALVNQSPTVIGADKLWGPALETTGQGIKIGIIDDGIDATHRFFDPSGYTYPAGFPKGRKDMTTPKVIVQRAFPSPDTNAKYAGVPFDPLNSFHGTHVAGIAAGNHGVPDGAAELTGIAPAAYLGNYKALTVPTTQFGLDGNSAEITAAIEAAVADGMNVINLSLGEPEIEPSRDIVVRAINAAAAAGVVPIVSAGNDFGQYGYGSISSPANASGAIAVAAAANSREIAGFSSAGPTPISLKLKPDITAPGVGITSSLPADQGGPWGDLEGTSMSAPQVAGGVALLLQQHPGWKPWQVKSALVQTGSKVQMPNGEEALTTRQGGGMIDLLRANSPLLFASPTAISFPVNGGTTAIALTDAGGGAGTWTVSVAPQQRSAGVTVTSSSSVNVPGRLNIIARVTPAAVTGDHTGFVLLTQGSEVRRIPYWLGVSRPLLGGERHILLPRPGVYNGTTRGGSTKIGVYRYPTGGRTYAGPEAVYRVKITTRVANFGVAVVSGRPVPHVTYAGDENRLVGYLGLPQALNPYLKTYGEPEPVAGAVLPLPGAYDVVFDTPRAAEAGKFSFRYWVNDTSPPRVRLEAGAPAGTIWLAATDAGAGVDPNAITATINGKSIRASYSAGRIVIRAPAGRHRLTVEVSDWQEAKNTEDVARIKPNTALFKTSVRVR